MECEINCKDKVEIKKGNKKKKSLEYFDIEVRNDYIVDGELSVFFSGGGYSFNYLPVKDWPKLKDAVDRLIIKAEHLIKEDC